MIYAHVDIYTNCRYGYLNYADIKVPTNVQTQNMTFSSSMSDEDFFKWLRSKGISDKDCRLSLVST